MLLSMALKALIIAVIIIGLYLGGATGWLPIFLVLGFFALLVVLRYFFPKFFKEWLGG